MIIRDEGKEVGVWLCIPARAMKRVNKTFGSWLDDHEEHRRSNAPFFGKEA